MADNEYIIDISSQPDVVLDVANIGARGRASTLTVGSTTTTAPQSTASVTNVGTVVDAILDFSIPRGNYWYSGAGAPSSGLGLENDLYLNTEDNTIYQKVSGSWVLQSIVSASATWGGITGTLSNQTDLQSELGSKALDSDLTSHTSDTSNPHSVTKTQVGLSNVPNTDCTNASNITSGTLSTDRLPVDNSSIVTNGGVISSLVPTGTCSTAGATANKTVTINGFTYTDGKLALIKMENANTSSTITMNINSLGAVNLYSNNGTQITGDIFYNGANAFILVRYNSTLGGLQVLMADFLSSRASMPAGSLSSITLGTSGSTYTAPTDGFIFINKNSTASGQYVQLQGANGMGTSSYSTATGQSLASFTILKKGDTATYFYTAGGTLNLFGFKSTAGVL